MHGNLSLESLLDKISLSVPGYAIGVGECGTAPRIYTGGCRTVYPEELPAEDHTLFDCASLTKPLITAALILVLAREGELCIDRKIELPGGYIPFPFGAPTVRQLLEHRAGFPDWLPLTLLASPERVIKLLPALQTETPGRNVEYTCPGYILLGYWLQCVTGRSLSELAGELLFSPLGISEDAFFPLPHDPELLDRCAATEFGNQIEREMAGPDLPERSSPLRGEVHDGNCLHLGGATGNSGLFATAGSVFALSSFLKSLLPPKIRRHKPYVLGLRTHVESPVFKNGQVGHTGFTGTHFVIDLHSEKIGVLLTNRLHQAQIPDLTLLRKEFNNTCL